MKKLLFTMILAVIVSSAASAQVIGTIDTTRFRPYFYYSQRYIWVNVKYDPTRVQTVYVYDICGRILLREPLKGQPRRIPITFPRGWYVAILDSASIKFFHQ